MRKNLLITLILALALLSVGAFAQRRPAKNVSANRHPNLAAAQTLSRQAYEKVVAAQRDNEWDLGGHAKRAKELLDQVNNELKAAAESANSHK